MTAKKHYVGADCGVDEKHPNLWEEYDGNFTQDIAETTCKRCISILERKLNKAKKKVN